MAQVTQKPIRRHSRGQMKKNGQLPNIFQRSRSEEPVGQKDRKKAKEKPMEGDREEKIYYRNLL